MTDNTSNNIKSHDHYFKKAMDRPQVAKEFFEENLPSNVLEIVDLSTLKPVSTSFIDNTLGEGILDLLYSVTIKGTEGYIWIICEHQSTQDKFMTLRLQKYMLRICSDHIKKYPNGKLPLIYPMLLYTGKSRHTAPLSFWELFESPELAQSFFTDKVQLIEVNQLPESLLRKKLYSGLMLYFMQKIHEPEILPFIKEFAGIISEISEKDFSYIVDLLQYILEKGESKNSEEVLSTLKEIVSEDRGDKLMTIAEQLREQGKNAGIQIGKEAGIQIGIEKGEFEGKLKVARRMLSKGQKIDLIAEITELPLEEIKKLQIN